jgi:hypothetical protein
MTPASSFGTTVALAAALVLCAPAAAHPGSEAPRPPPAPPSALAAAAAEAADPLSVYVMTFGPGDHPFFKFGHDALWIRDRNASSDLVYNFGTFKFDSPRLILEFLKGRMTYWLSVSTLSATLASYERENRSVLAQELVLPAAEKRALQARVTENARPENRAYKYDYFLDNCSTRVRDAVDRSTGGALRATGRAPGRLTLRDQALRLTADTLWLYVALDLVLAGRTDQPIDRWAEMYVPEELARGVRATSVPGPAGAPVPLVLAEHTMYQSTRPPPAQVPPSMTATFLLCGLAVALVFVALGWGAPGRPLVRVLFGLLLAAWGLCTGFIGSFLIYAWAFTDHVVAHRNENILQCAPWALLLGLLGLGLAVGMRGATRLAARLVVAALLLSAAGWAAKLLPGFGQHNAELIAFFLPVWFGAAIGVVHVKNRS